MPTPAPMPTEEPHEYEGYPMSMEAERGPAAAPGSGWIPQEQATLRAWSQMVQARTLPPTPREERRMVVTSPTRDDVRTAAQALAAERVQPSGRTLVRHLHARGFSISKNTVLKHLQALATAGETFRP